MDQLNFEKVARLGVPVLKHKVVHFAHGKAVRRWVLYLSHTEGRYCAEVPVCYFGIVKPTKKQIRQALSAYHKDIRGEASDETYAIRA